ncbi:hypothetical protein ACFFGH_17125 [Lysobacter korlensis]|uniref:Tetratricopeptide repeat protein n=1 Tax=Lysobacter korlensis TaxID=553636 RepID=A0ABV6RRZ3_9GAMM
MLDRCARTIAVVVGSLVFSCAFAASRPAVPVSPPLGLPQAQARGPLAELYSRIERAVASADRGDAAAARRELDAIVADPLFPTLSAQQQRELLSTNAVLAWKGEDTARAAELMRAATVAYGNDPDDWYRLAILELQLGQRSRATRQMAAFVRRWPELVNNLDRLVLSDLLFQGEPRDEDLIALMDALFDAHWTDNDRGVDEVWPELALLHLGRGGRERAEAVVATIKSPMALASMRSDLRFDPLHDALARLPSVEAAATGEVERLRALHAKFPKRVDLAADLGTALLVAGRDTESLAVSEAALAAIEAAGEAGSFESFEDRIWVMNNKAIALRRAGRFDEAATQFELAGELDENGGDNVSQRLNLGTFLCRIGRPTDALRVIEPVGHMSGYGRMVQTAVRHCAALQLRDTAGAAKALAYLYDHRADARGIVVDELLRAGDVDRAAAELIRSLDDPRSRAQALESVQQFRAPLPLPAFPQMDANRAKLVARADVQAAVGRVGRALRHEIFNVSGVD